MLELVDYKNKKIKSTVDAVLVINAFLKYVIKIVITVETYHIWALEGILKVT